MTDEREMMADAYAALERANEAEQARNRHQQEAQQLAGKLAELRAAKVERKEPAEERRDG